MTASEYALYTQNIQLKSDNQGLKILLGGLIVGVAIDYARRYYAAKR